MKNCCGTVQGLVRPLAVASLCLAALLACKNGTLQSSEPARLKDPDAASRAELREAVSQALGGVEVTLAADTLTDSSVLIVERRARRDPQGNRLPGRELEAPDRFQLSLSGGRCYLLHEQSGKRHELTRADCIPE